MRHDHNEQHDNEQHDDKQHNDDHPGPLQGPVFLDVCGWRVEFTFLDVQRKLSRMFPARGTVWRWASRSDWVYPRPDHDPRPQQVLRDVRDSVSVHKQ